MLWCKNIDLIQHNGICPYCNNKGDTTIKVITVQRVKELLYKHLCAEYEGAIAVQPEYYKIIDDLAAEEEE